MKPLRKNLRKLWISIPIRSLTWGMVRNNLWGDLQHLRWDELQDESGMREILTPDGLGSGEWGYPYLPPVEVKGNVGIPGGKRSTGDAIVLSDFGFRERYDRIIVLYDKSLPITETTRLWVDKNPSEGTHDYEPVRIMESLNSLLVAVKKVTVSG